MILIIMFQATSPTEVDISFSKSGRKSSLKKKERKERQVGLLIVIVYGVIERESAECGAL